MFTHRHARQRVLLIDDDASQILALRQILQSVADIHFARSGTEGIGLVRELQPDLVLLDIEMPGLDGFETCKAIQADASTASIPVIFLTSHTSVESQVRCFQEGGVDYISKPFQPEVVVARVTTQLSLRLKNKELIESGRHARVTLECIGDAVVTTDPHGVVTYINPVAESMIGIAQSHALGKVIEDLMPLRLGDDGPTHFNPLRLAIAENRIVGMAMDCQMLTQKGTWIPVEDSAAPLLSTEGEVLGGVIVFHDVSEARAMAIKMSQMLHYDQLTNLPNKVLLLDRVGGAIEDAERVGLKVGLIAINIDKFKLINEEFGFAFGDQALRSLAHEFSGALQHGETLSRYHGDEFIVVAPSLHSSTQIADLATSLQSAAQRVASSCTELGALSVTQGISIFPDDALDSETLIRHADSAMFKAKSTAVGGFCFYSDEIDHSLASRRQIYSWLKNAIATDGVKVLYQPLVSSATHKTIAVEALMRVVTPGGQILTPDKFMPIAEETRLISGLGRTLIEQVLAQVATWWGDDFKVKACINVSTVQFKDPEFWSSLKDLIERSGVNPKAIELELTESLMLDSVDEIAGVMREMRAFGITLSIDDFGTGYSSLAYLRNLPIDVLKIDRTFVSDLNEQGEGDTIVRTIIAMAKALKMQTVAEGVETPCQADFLRELGVNHLQGYLFSKPVPASDVLQAYEVGR